MTHFAHSVEKYSHIEDDCCFSASISADWYSAWSLETFDCIV